jgi:hypothetical protein
MENIKERPIPFSTDMVKAILDGRKTMTRRVCKVQPNDAWHIRNYEQSTFPYGRYQVLADGYDSNAKEYKCPYGQVGDRLWCKETYDLLGGYIHDGSYQQIEPIYKASWPGIEHNGAVRKWKSGRFMFKKYARLWLEITNIRVERLQEISEKDARAEGSGCSIAGILPATYTECFQSLWDSINGKTYPWESNPFVWVIEFKKVI